MAKIKTKKTKVKSKVKKEKKLKLGTFKETAREKLIGQHIGYRYDVNLLPDYKRITPFLKNNQLLIVILEFKVSFFQINKRVLWRHLKLNQKLSCNHVSILLVVW